MPQYFVFDKKTGVIVHQHETYDGPSDANVACNKEDVLELIDKGLVVDTLDVIEIGDDFQIAEVRDIRVDPDTRKLVYERVDSDT